MKGKISFPGSWCHSKARRVITAFGSVNCLLLMNLGGGEAKTNKLPHSGRQEEGLLLLSFTETTSRSKCVQNTVANVPGDQHLGELARISI